MKPSKNAKLKKVTETEIKEMQLSCGMAGMVISIAEAEAVLMVMDCVKRFGGDFDLWTASRIKGYIVDKYSEKEKK